MDDSNWPVPLHQVICYWPHYQDFVGERRAAAAHQRKELWSLENVWRGDGGLGVVVGGVMAVLRLGEDVQRVVRVKEVSTLSSVVAPVAPIDDDVAFPNSGSDVVPAMNTSSLFNLLQREKFRWLSNLEGNTMDKVIGVGVV